MMTLFEGLIPMRNDYRHMETEIAALKAEQAGESRAVNSPGEK